MQFRPYDLQEPQGTTFRPASVPVTVISRQSCTHPVGMPGNEQASLAHCGARRYGTCANASLPGRLPLSLVRSSRV